MQKLSRRHVLATLSATSLTLCPAVLNAAVYGWPEGFSDEEPQGQAATLDVSGGQVADITALRPGEMAVLSRPSTDDIFSRTGGTQYVGILHRTAEQVAAGTGGAAAQDDRYLVVNLVCPHRGFAIGLTDDPTRPFACTRTSGRHGSIFDAGASAVGGASDEGELLSVPDYTISVGDKVTVTLT